MNDYIKIAWRNISRHKLRSFISILAIAVVVMIVVFSRGLILGFSESTYSQYIDNNLGHVRIINEEYQHREALLTLEYTIDGYNGAGINQMLADLKEIEEVKHLLPRLKFGALYGDGGELLRMMGIGIDPVAEKEYANLPANIKQGRMPETANEILVGKGLLRDLGVEVGDRVTFMFSDVFQSLQGRTFSIVGMYETGFSALDDHIFYLPLATAQSMLRLEDQVTEIMVFGSNRDNSKFLATEIAASFRAKGEEKYSALNWETADSLLAIFREMDGIWDLVYAAFILMGSIVVISTLTMIIRERKSEIGMMLALGLKGKDIMKIFTLEGAFMGLIGSVLGTIGGGIINYYLSQAGLQVEAFAETLGGMDVLVEPAFYPVYNLENLIVSFLFGVVIVSLACLYPAYKAAQIEPVVALHDDN